MGVKSGTPPVDQGDDSNPLVILNDEESRKKFVELYGLVRLLGGCIISDRYKIPVSLVNAVRLPDLGEQVFNQLLPQNSQNTIDLKMAVFLQALCSEGLLMSLASDPEAIRSAVAKEVRDRKILFPWIYGRELHDAWLQKWPEVAQLDNRKTIDLLRNQPIGVFQCGYTVTGPLGVLSSEVSRALPPSGTFPGYLCSTPTCHAVHPIGVTTGESVVSKIRSRVSRFILENHSAQKYEMGTFVREAHLVDMGQNRYTSTSALLDTLADAFELDQLQLIAENMLRARLREDEYRKSLARTLTRVIANPADLVQTFDRASLLQFMLLHSDAEIEQAADLAISRGSITVEPYEKMVSRVNRHRSSIKIEIGCHGTRYIAPIPSAFIAKRLLDLLRFLYIDNEHRTSEDLAFQLDLNEINSEDQLLNEAIKNYDPLYLIDRLVSSSRSAINEAAEFLPIAEQHELKRGELHSVICWKLGVSPQVAFDESQPVLEHRDRLLESLSQGRPEDVLRGHISNVFTSLERVLKRSLEYAGWALTTDHYTSRLGFMFDPAISSGVQEFIERYSPTSDKELQLLKGGNTLVPLSAAFARLGKSLRRQQAVDYVRPDHELPEGVRINGLPFCWNSILPFLDLTAEAQTAVVEYLIEISRLLQDEAVISTRNAFLHDSESIPATGQIETAMQRVETAIRVLQDSGLTPRVFEIVQSVTDAAGLNTTDYISLGRTISLYRPSVSYYSRLPSQEPHLLIIPCAITKFGDPLRFRLHKNQGPDDYWRDWPYRMAANHIYADLEEVHSGTSSFEAAI